MPTVLVPVRGCDKPAPPLTASTMPTGAGNHWPIDGQGLLVIVLRLLSTAFRR
jgi:hypothetical protein